jgi:hypothetical protein
MNTRPIPTSESRAASATMLEFLEGLYDAVATESRRDLPRPAEIVDRCGSDAVELRAYLDELLDRLIASQVLLYGEAVRAWAERKREEFDPERMLRRMRGVLESTRRARAFEALRPLVAELRPTIVEQEIDSEFRRLHEQLRRR